jgi:hypothetical protein
MAARNGLNPYEANDIQRRIARLEQRVNYAMSSRYGRYGNAYNGGYGHQGERDDHDRDHRGYGDDDHDD